MVAQVTEGSTKIVRFGGRLGGYLVDLVLWSIVGGIVGTVLMDIADKSMAWVNFTTGAA